MSKEYFDPFKKVEKEQTPPPTVDPFADRTSAGGYFSEQTPPQGGGNGDQTPPQGGGFGGQTPPQSGYFGGQSPASGGYDPFSNMTPQGGYYGPEYFGAPVPPPGTPKKPARGMAITSMVMGILSIVLCYSLACFNIIPGILAVVFALVAPKNENGKMQGMAIAGLVCGIVGTVMGLGIIFILLVDVITQPFYY